MSGVAQFVPAANKLIKKYMWQEEEDGGWGRGVRIVLSVPQETGDIPAGSLLS